jgi:hypothetical protein
MIYEVYAGGIHALQSELTVDMSNPQRYDISLSAKTRGLLGKLAPWHGTFETQGWRAPNGDLQPQLHKSTATWRDENEVKEYKYNRDGTFDKLVIDEHDKPPRVETTESDLTNGTIDVFTATLDIMSKIAQGQPCEGNADVFDGKRRFSQVFAPEKPDMLAPSKYNIYGGQAQKCTVEVVPKGGEWHKKPRGWMSIQEQGREKGTMPTIWMARLSDNGPAIPVKILVKTNYGALVMHLAEYREGGNIRVADKRAELLEE